jgi:hypothetical protein
MYMVSWRRRGALAVAACAAALLVRVVGAQRGAPSVTDPKQSAAEIAPDMRPVLRVCAHPENLPFSNAQGEGFENRLAALLAEELHAMLVYAFVTASRSGCELSPWMTIACASCVSVSQRR